MNKDEADKDNMRPDYDFSAGVRGVTAARYAQGTNLIKIDAAVLDVFPDEKAVNQALRSLASLVRQSGRRSRTSR